MLLDCLLDPVDVRVGGVAYVILNTDAEEVEVLVSLLAECAHEDHPFDRIVLKSAATAVERSLEVVQMHSTAFARDPRTGLRRSDRGIDHLGALIRDGLPFERPWGNVVITQSGAVVEGQIRINVERGLSVSRPRVWTNGVELEDLSFSFREAAYSERMLSATELIPPTNIHSDIEGDAALFALRIVWNMPVWPQWYAGAHLADPRLMAVLSTNRNFETDIAVNWAYPADDLRRGGATFAENPE